MFQRSVLVCVATLALVLPSIPASAQGDRRSAAETYARVVDYPLLIEKAATRRAAELPASEREAFLAFITEEVDSEMTRFYAISAMVDLFEAGELVDVTGVSKGHGFTGVIARHHFRRGPKTHGSDHHRAPGSIGAGTYPGRVWKGTRMAGHMGNERVTVKKLKVVRVDPERNLILVRGAVPGARNGLLLVQKAK